MFSVTLRSGSDSLILRKLGSALSAMVLDHYIIVHVGLHMCIYVTSILTSLNSPNDNWCKPYLFGPPLALQSHAPKMIPYTWLGATVSATRVSVSPPSPSAGLTDCFTPPEPWFMLARWSSSLRWRHVTGETAVEDSGWSVCVPGTAKREYHNIIRADLQ